MINVAKWTFSVGHVFNDLCASMWFLYTLVYFTKVASIDKLSAGYIMLIGQVADAISTTIVGFWCDRVGFLCGRYIGRRKSWHVLGTILTALSFPFVFNKFIYTKDTWIIVIYYSVFVIIFQFAWATVQISNLSLIPVLVADGHNNSTLNSMRYMFTVISNIAILLATTLLFHSDGNQSNTNSTNPNGTQPFDNVVSISPKDQPTFTFLTIGIVAFGILFSFVFQIGVPERKVQDSLKDQSSIGVSESVSLLSSSDCKLTTKDWFKEPQFYLINMLYLATRLLVNVSQTYLLLYVYDSLVMSKIHGPLAALTTYITGAVVSIVMKIVQQKIGPKFCYLIGLVITSGYCVMVGFTDSDYVILMYVSMTFLGAGCSMTMIGSMSLTAELIGNSYSSSAFVYGTMSFSDKLFNGIAIMILQRFSQDSLCSKYYRYIEIYFVGGTVVFGLVILVILFPMKIGMLRKHGKSINGDQPSYTDKELCS